MTNRHSIFLLLVIVLFAVVGNIIWISLDQSPPIWDFAGHSQRSAWTADQLRSFQFGDLLLAPAVYPPVSYFVTAFLFIVFGPHEDIPQLSLIPWMLLLLFSVYWIARRLFHRTGIALFAAALLTIYPLLTHFSRIYGLDYQLTAIVAAAQAALLATDRFTRRRQNILFAVASAIAMLTKWTAVFYLLPTFGYLFVSALRDSTRSRSAILKELLRMAGVFVILAGPWYAAHAFEVLKNAYATRLNIFSVPYEQLLDPQSLLYYAKKAAEGMIWPLAVLSAAGFVRALWKRTSPDRFLLAWIIGSYLILTFLYSKESRYLLPAYPALALLAASFVFSFRRAIAAVVVVTSLAVGLFVWTETSWKTRLLPGQTYRRVGLAQTYGYKMITSDRVGYGFTTPTAFHLAVKEIPEAIADDVDARQSRPTRIRIAIVPNSMAVQAQQVMYYARLSGFDIWTNPVKIDYALSSLVRGSSWRNHLLEADYLVTKSGHQGPPPWVGHLDEIMEEEKKGDKGLFAHFVRVRSWRLKGIEEGLQEVRLYRRIADGPPPTGVVAEAYGCFFSLTERNGSTVQVSKSFSANDETDQYLLSVSSAYFDALDRNPRCEELQFHLDHATSLGRLTDWLNSVLLRRDETR